MAKYIMVDEYAFEVVSGGASELGKVDGGEVTFWEMVKGFGRGGVKLRGLDRDEIRGIPIFAIREELGPSGLIVCEL